MGDRPRHVRLAPAATLPVALYGTILLVLVGCFAFPPLPGTVAREDRLRAFPRTAPALTADAEMLFSDEQVPFVLAKADEDVPYLLGMELLLIPFDFRQEDILDLTGSKLGHVGHFLFGPHEVSGLAGIRTRRRQWRPREARRSPTAFVAV